MFLQDSNPSQRPFLPWRLRLIPCVWVALCLVSWLAPAADAASQASEGPPNILLITIDTLRPDALGWVAGSNKTPVIDALAEAGFGFPRAVAPVPVTLPSHASIFSGLLPRHHGVRANGQVLGAGFPILAERLREQGYRTAAFVSGYPLAAAYGLDRGFEHYDDHWADDRRPAGDGERLERPAAMTVDAALDWFKKNSPEVGGTSPPEVGGSTSPPEVGGTSKGQARPWFVWIHFYDPHDPYQPPLAFRGSGIRDAYNGEVAYVDAEIGRLLQALEPSAAKRLTVLTADHGESLGEHGEATHGFFVYESTMAVPLILHFPGRLKPGRSDAAARLIDIMPTVLDLLGQESPRKIDGASLVPFLDGTQLAIGDVFPTAYLESHRPWLSYGWAPLRAVRQGDWKLIAAPQAELYNLQRDPDEAINLIDEQRPVARQLIAELRRLEASDEQRATATTDPDALARLRALGYVGSVTPNRPPPTGGLADPKDKVSLWNRLSEAERHLMAGRGESAVKVFDEVLAAEPKNPFAWSRSGQALAEMGALPQAAERLKRAVELIPQHVETRISLAHTLSRLQRWDEAIQQWLEVTAQVPRRVDAWTQLGNVFGRSGQGKRAVEAFARAAALAPEQPDPLVRLGFAQFGAGQMAEAVASLQQAAVITGEENFPHAAALGLLLVRIGRNEESLSWLRRSRPQEGDFADARLTLARLEAARGDKAAAKQALQMALRARPGLRGRVEADPELSPLLR